MAYRKGYGFERSLKLDLESKGWKVIRSGGSKKPDLVAAKDGKIVVIECKFISNNYVYLEKDEVYNLMEVAKHFNGEGIYCIRKKGDPNHILISLDQLRETENNFVVRLSN